MKQKTETPAFRGAGDPNAFLRGSWNTSEDARNAREFQVARLIERLRIPAPTARVLAELAFTGGPAR